MNKKTVSLITAAIMIVSSAVPVFAAASPTAANAVVTPVTVPQALAAAKGYTLTPEEEAAVATTPEEAAALAAGVTATTDGGVELVVSATAPINVSTAKADILKDSNVKAALKKNGVAGTIVNAGALTLSDGSTAKKTVSLSAAGLTAGQKVIILYYVPGDPKPHVVRASWKNGKLRVTLPIPCIYNIVK